MKTHLTTLFAALAFASLAACQSQPATEKASESAPKTEAKTEAKADAKAGGGGPATLEMYVTSQCPYGVQVMNAVAPVKEQLGKDLNLKIGYIGNGSAGSFQSLHGPAEVK